MPQRLDNRLVIGISSRTLFDLEDSHRRFEEEGVEAYSAFQIRHENDVLKPGVAFPLVRKLLRLNQGRDEPLVEVILLSRNSADTGLRVFNSIEHHELGITRAAFTNGESPWRYIGPFGADLFLSAHGEDVGAALQAGCAAATLVPAAAEANDSDQIRIAFDGDAVLFSDEAERIFREKGLDAFRESEKSAARRALSGGPFRNFLSALHRIQQAFPAESSPIRTALVTARDAPAHERVIRTLREWEIRIDEALFLGGMDKTAFLQAFGADIFFDDQRAHVERANGKVATGHVPHGIANEGGGASGQGSA
ncbi:5'-nucleotidase [Gammaproteobacteria bacterium AB-CW1]|uniref:5'-nucleotidase n=1 Tax=Natronospira elongata TaxID=3110268 RepID=A0AAP6MJF7_9GAMM|nr:5'-nucleotidase [Gammaproteobacteria bacterium AB-CW1]